MNTDNLFLPANYGLAQPKKNNAITKYVNNVYELFQKRYNVDATFMKTVKSLFKAHEELHILEYNLECVHTINHVDYLVNITVTYYYDSNEWCLDVHENKLYNLTNNMSTKGRTIYYDNIDINFDIYKNYIYNELQLYNEVKQIVNFVIEEFLNYE